jgi:GT2 family glycosyltransferase
MHNVDFLITTFMRPDCLTELVLSIAHYYPDAKVFIGDQNQILAKKFYEQLQERAGFRRSQFKVFKLPFDCGLSRARNFLVQNTPSAYKLILDDDFIFTRETDLYKFLTLIEQDGVGVVAGAVKTNGMLINYEYKLDKQDDTMFYAPDGDQWQEYKGITYKQTGCVLNFALYRKEVFEDVLWDRDLKVTEHLEFMWRLNQTPWKILYTPEVITSHSQERNHEYKKMRKRTDFRFLSFQKMGISKVHYVHNGHTVELKDGKIINTREYGTYKGNLG